MAKNNRKLSFEQIKGQADMEYWLENEQTSTFWIGRLTDSFGRAILDREDEDKIGLIEAVLAQLEAEDSNSRYPIAESKEWLGYNGIRFSVDNSKLTGGYLITNLSGGLTCYSRHCGYCKEADICYAGRDERRYKNLCYNNLNNMLWVIKLSPEEAAKRLAEKLTKGQRDYIHWHRINVNGEFWNIASFVWAVEFASHLKRLIPNLVTSYSYSHNKELKQANSGDLVVNWSIPNKYGEKQCKVYRQFLELLADESKFVICDGNCDKCSYCKDKEETRLIVFFEHGAKKVWKDQVPDWFKELVARRKRADWLDFCSRMGIDPETF